MTRSSLITKGRLATLIVVAILLIDQAIKIWVKTSMSLHESIHVFDWFYITFIENMGMAVGLLPITGIPLPFISLGGTSMLINFLAFGVILNYSMSRNIT